MKMNDTCKLIEGWEIRYEILYLLAIVIVRCIDGLLDLLLISNRWQCRLVSQSASQKYSAITLERLKEKKEGQEQEM